MEWNAIQRCHHIIPISAILFGLLVIKLEKVIFFPCGALAKSWEISCEKVKPSSPTLQ